MSSNLTSTNVHQIFSKLPIGAPAVELWLNGLYTCLLVATLYTFVNKPGSSRRHKISWMSILIALYFFATAHSTMTVVNETSVFHFHGGDPSIVQAFIDQSPAFKGIIASVFIATGLISDGIFIWRCWVVWERRWSICVIPILSTIVYTVLSVFGIMDQVQVADKRSPGVIPRRFVDVSTPLFVLSLVTSLYSTLFITLRVILVQREVKLAGLQINRQYSRVVEIVVESAALNTINLLALVVCIARKSDKLDWPQDTQPQIAGIAPTLIILRVALGHARPDSDWSSAQFTSLGAMAFSPSEPSVLPTTTVSSQSYVQNTSASLESDPEKTPDDSQALSA